MIRQKKLRTRCASRLVVPFAVMLLAITSALAAYFVLDFVLSTTAAKPAPPLKENCDSSCKYVEFHLDCIIISV